MFPHFSIRRERSACLHKFFFSCFVSFGSCLGLVFFWFGLVLHGGRGVHRSFGCMFVSCRLVDVMMMICNSMKKDYVRPVVLYKKFCTTQLPNVQVCHAFGDSVNANHHALHHRVGTENSGLDSEMFPPTWRLAAWLIECSRIGCFVRGKN